jgi:hypothetical protein
MRAIDVSTIPFHGCRLSINSTFSSEHPLALQELALYDPNRKPASWMEVIRPGQYAAFLSDIETGAEMTSDGNYFAAGLIRCCVLFVSLEEAEQYCCAKVEEFLILRCDGECSVVFGFRVWLKIAMNSLTRLSVRLMEDRGVEWSGPLLAKDAREMGHPRLGGF